MVDAGFNWMYLIIKVVCCFVIVHSRAMCFCFKYICTSNSKDSWSQQTTRKGNVQWYFSSYGISWAAFVFEFLILRKFFICAVLSEFVSCIHLFFGFALIILSVTGVNTYISANQYYWILFILWLWVSCFKIVKFRLYLS